MKWKIKQSRLSGSITIPPSKSHTIRALLIATLADGESVVREPLMSGDGKSALAAAAGLGARVDHQDGHIVIGGIAGNYDGGRSELYLANSGTSTRLFASAASLGSRPRTFDGDGSLRRRPMKPLLDALASLGARYKTLETSRDMPFTIRGPIHGGRTTVRGTDSQYLSSLLLTAPLLDSETTITVRELNERPYVEITLWWLERMGIRFAVSDDFSTFTVGGGQSYGAIDQRIPGDFSSATFAAVAAAITGSEVTLENIDFSDPQGDKAVFEVLARMGATVTHSALNATVRVDGPLRGTEVDLNAMPDALPAMAVLGCIAEGTTSLVNVPQARIKECDRIERMAALLAAMGARTRELDDGLVVEHGELSGTTFGESDHRGDHRVVMALALAGMAAKGETVIENAEAAEVTYPGFARDFGAIGAEFEEIEAYPGGCSPRL